METILIVVGLVLAGVAIYFMQTGKIKDADSNLIPDAVEGENIANVSEKAKTIKDEASDVVDAVKEAVASVKEAAGDVKTVVNESKDVVSAVKGKKKTNKPDVGV